MSASIHAAICQAFMALSLILGVPFFCAASSDFRLAIGFMVIYVLLYVALFSWIPVHCSTPGCVGRMRRGMTRVSFFKARLDYDCDACKDACDHEIFFPDITIEASG